MYPWLLRLARYYAKGKQLRIIVSGDGWTQGETAAPLGYTAGLFRVALAAVRHIEVVMQRPG